MLYKDDGGHYVDGARVMVVVSMVAAVVMFVGWIWAVQRVARNWRNAEFWAKYRQNQIDGFGEKAGTRFARCAPQGIFTLAPAVLGTFAVGTPYLVRLVRGEEDLGISRTAAYAGTVGFAWILLALILAGIVYFTGRPEVLVPKHLRPERREKRARYRATSERIQPKKLSRAERTNRNS